VGQDFSALSRALRDTMSDATGFIAPHLAEKPNCIIFSGRPLTLTPESEILRNSKPLPAKKP
jgi:hypothetical protein